MDINFVRKQFPAFSEPSLKGFAHFENAGGSQLPIQVIERMQRFLVEGYVQTGAGYPASDIVDQTIDQAKSFANVLMNGEGTGQTLIGPSTTNLLYRLAGAMAHQIEQGETSRAIWSC